MKTKKRNQDQKTSSIVKKSQIQTFSFEGVKISVPEFSEIFNESKLLGVRLHQLLHHWLSSSSIYFEV